MKKMGRPPKGDETATEKVAALITKKLKDKVVKAAKAKRVTLSQFLSRLIEDAVS